MRVCYEFESDKPVSNIHWIRRFGWYKFVPKIIM